MFVFGIFFFLFHFNSLCSCFWWHSIHFFTNQTISSCWIKQCRFIHKHSNMMIVMTMKIFFPVLLHQSGLVLFTFFPCCMLAATSVPARSFLMWTFLYNTSFIWGVSLCKWAESCMNVRFIISDGTQLCVHCAYMMMFIHTYVHRSFVLVNKTPGVRPCQLIPDSLPANSKQAVSERLLLSESGLGCLTLLLYWSISYSSFTLDILKRHTRMKNEIVDHKDTPAWPPRDKPTKAFK